MTLSEEITKTLKAYYSAEGLIPGSAFACKYINNCPEPPGESLARGMQCHIGSKYGEDGKMKILVASLDCGGGGKGTIEERRERVVSDAKKDTHNLHMTGTFKALSYFLGEKEPSKLVHYMIMTNTCKCCRESSTRQMDYKFFQRCGEYTIAEIETIKPDVILFQGKSSSIGCSSLLYPIAGIEDVEISHSLRLFKHNGFNCYAVLCIHPSARFKYTKARIEFYNETLPKIADHIKSHPLK